MIGLDRLSQNSWLFANCNRQGNIGHTLIQNRPSWLGFIRHALLLVLEGLLKAVARTFQYHDVATMRQPV